MNGEQLHGGEASPHNGAELPHEELSVIVRYMRQQLGMTQEELAQALGITVGTVSRWEKGRFRPSRLARALILQFARTHNVVLSLRAGVQPS